MMWSTIPLLLAAAAVQVEARATGRNAVVVEASSAASNDYDYIIAGGGLAGLTVADRLTENPKGKCKKHCLVFLH